MVVVYSVEFIMVVNKCRLACKTGWWYRNYFVYLLSNFVSA